MSTRESAVGSRDRYLRKMYDNGQVADKFADMRTPVTGSENKFHHKGWRCECIDLCDWRGSLTDARCRKIKKL